MGSCEDEMPSHLRKLLAFVPFNRESYDRLVLREQVDKLRNMEGKDRAQEARLKDGELKFGMDESINKRPEKNPDLEEGNWLKEEYGEPPRYFMGLPMEEFDTGIEQKTFVVLTRRLHRIHISRFSATPSGFVLFPWNPIRRLAVYVCTNQIFDFFILFTILVNCICLAIPRLSDLNWLELVFFAIYSVEMVVKVSARGLVINKYTYLRDPWNWLDFIVIASGVASFTMYAENDSNAGVTQALRTFRVLRAVKTISIFPGLRTIVNAMLRAIRMLLEVVLMTVFCLLVFSLVSVQVYRGSMRQKCVLDPKILERMKEHHEPYSIFYRRMLNSKRNWAVDQNGNYMLCGNASGAGRCQGDYICQPNIGGNPNNGFMNFDNIFWSALITFQLMTIDFWENAYRKVLLTNGSVTVVFFVMTVFFGSFYLLNLMLAVVTITYQEEAERTNKEIESEKNAKRQRKQAVATFYNMTNLATKQNIWAKIVHENKSKEKIKEAENPMEKLMRMRKILARWKKATARSDMVVSPEILSYCNFYSSGDRTSKLVAQNVLYSAGKWRHFAKRKNKDREKSVVSSGKMNSLDVTHGSIVLPACAKYGHFLSMANKQDLTKQSAVDGDSVVLPACTTKDIETTPKQLRFPGDIDVAPSPTPSLVPRKRLPQQPWKQSDVDSVAPSKHGGPKYSTSLKTDDTVDFGVSVEFGGSSVDHSSKKEDKGGYNERSTYKSEPNDDDKNRLPDKSKPTDDTQNSNVNAGTIEVKEEQDDFSSIAASEPSQRTRDDNDPSLRLPVPEVATERFKLASMLLKQPATKMSFTSVVSKSMLQKLATSHAEREIVPQSRWRQMAHTVQSRCWECCPSFWSFFEKRLSRIRGVLHSIVTDIFFDLFINFVIVVNTIVMSSEHHGMSDWTKELIKVGSILFTVIFALEAILKIAGLGVQGYFSSSWNRFDFFVAVGSVISSYLETEQFRFNKTQFLRAFRLLRILKLGQVWPAMNSLLTIIGSALGALGQLTCILLIILYIFAIIGLHLFKDKYTEINFPNGVPRWNFNDFFHSFIMMFRVLCGEWIEALWDCMKITEVHAGVCMLVFLPTLIFGNFIVLNLFLALLLNAFDDVGSSKQEHGGAWRLKEAKERFHAKFNWLIRCCERKQVNKVSVIIHKPGYVSEKHMLELPASRSASATNTADTVATAIHSLPFMNSRIMEDPARKETLSSFVDPKTDEGQSSSSGQFDHPKEIHRRGAKNVGVDMLVMKSTTASLFQAVDVPSCFPSCILFHFHNTRSAFNESTYGSAWMKCRTAVMKKIDNDIFEYIVLFFIIASSIAVAFEDYYFQLLAPDDLMRTVAYQINYVFMASFVLEMILRWLAFGVTRYFTSAWTIIDFIVVVVSILSVIAKDTDLNVQSFRALLALRALRPLRVVSRIQGMKIVVNSLMRAIPAILNVFVVSLVFWLIFSVMGVQFYAGKFYKCIDLHTQNWVNVSGKEECLENPDYLWFNSHINFDHIGNGFLALFQVATFEGWMEIMHDAVDATEVDLQPQKEASFASYLYFIAFIICGSFFSLNLVIGVIIDNFNVLKRKYEGSFLDAFLTLNQRNYYNTLKKMSLRKPQKIITPPRYRFQKMFYELSVSDRFELILMSVVMLNMLAVGIEYYQYIQQCFWLEVMFTAEIGFTTFFALEALVKIVGLRQHYFTLPWNVYDFLVAVISIVSVSVRMTNVFYEEAHQGESKFLDNGVLFSPTFLRLLRIFRVSRSLRIIKVAKGLRKVMYSLVISLPAIVNIMALLALFMFVYAVFGMFLFANVKLTGALTPMMNFRTAVNSYLMLLCLSTAAGWNDILDALMIAPPFCNITHHQLSDGRWIEASNGNCGNVFAIPFMVSYIIITFLFIINLYIAVILENYQQAHQQEEVGVTEDDFDMFYTIWQRYDPHATQFIPYAMLSDFVADLEPPLGIEKPNEIALVSINLPILEGDRVHCLDILLALVKNVLADIEESEDMDQLKQQINNKFSERFPNRTNMNIISTTIQRKKEDVAARTLQRAWQVFKTQQTIYSIMKLSVKDRLKSSISLPRTTPTVEELGQNMYRASRLYMKKLFEQSESRRAIGQAREGLSDGEDEV